MLRCETIDTMYHLIERTNVEINDILDNCNLSCDKTLCFLTRHVDNLKDAMMILDKIHDHEDIFLLLEKYDCNGFQTYLMKKAFHNQMCTNHEETADHHSHEATVDKPVIVKK